MGKLTYLTEPQVARILAAVEASAHPKRERIHGEIFAGFWLGTRATETALLRREHFAQREGFALPTLKGSRRIPHQCPQCARRIRVAASRSGREVFCLECGARSTILARGTAPTKTLVELPFVEDHVWEYFQDYIGRMPDYRKCLFERRHGVRVTARDVWVDLKQALAMASMDLGYKPHSLRHGRAMYIFKHTNSERLIQACLRHSSLMTTQIYVTLSKESDYKRVLEAARK